MFVKIAALCLLAVASIQAYPSQVARDHPTGRIIKGQEAERGAFPYQISLQYGSALTHSNVCGGTILNSRWVLTAGNCITDIKHHAGENYYVVAGIHNLINDVGQVVRVRQAIVHPDYKGGVNPNDIALLELDGELELGDNVSPVQLPESDSIPSGNGTLSGWGSVSQGSWPAYPRNLQTIELSLLSIAECKNVLINVLGHSDPLDGASNVCTAPLQVGLVAAGVCYRDAGSPLVAKGSVVQVGIVSWGVKPCASRGAPSVYTRVSAFIDWINENIN